jgi:hypothetical protein
MGCCDSSAPSPGRYITRGWVSEFVPLYRVMEDAAFSLSLFIGSPTPQLWIVLFDLLSMRLLKVALEVIVSNCLSVLMDGWGQVKPLHTSNTNLIWVPLGDSLVREVAAILYSILKCDIVDLLGHNK